MKKISNEKGKFNRREFLATTAAIGVATVVPRSVLGKGFIPPSDKITLVHVGCGYQGLSEIASLLRCPQIEVVGVADPNRQTNDYIGWSVHGLRNSLRRLIDEPNWFEGVTGHPGGRDVMKYVVETYYKKNRPGYTGTVAAEEDYREMNEFYTNEKLNNATLDKVYYEKFRKILTESKIYNMFQAEKSYRHDLIKQVKNRGKENILK